MISITSLTISSAAHTGTVVGSFAAFDASGNSIACNMMLDEGSSGFFSVASTGGGNDLVVAWPHKTPIPVGYYPVVVSASGIDAAYEADAAFVVHVQ